MGLGNSNADSEDQVTDRHDSWESDVPATTANPARLVVGIAGACGLMACMLLLWHFTFAQPAPVAPATATFVAQPPIQPVIPVQPVTPLPVTPQPPTTPATQPATPVAQPAPPKPVAKDGREPIEYQPFRPDVWKAKNQSTWLFPWEGERIVLLTTTADLDPKTMAVFVKQLDAGWKLCSDLVGQSPRPFKQHNGKVTIAAVPDNSFSGGGLVAYLGVTGIEVGGFYAPRGDYDQVRQNPAKFPDGFFFGIGQNHFMFASQCGVLSTGGIVALRHICAEAINGSDKDPQADQTIYRYEEAFAKSNATFQEAFAPFGATKPYVLNDLDGKPFGNIDLNVFIASTFLKLRKDNGGNEWTKRFFRHLGTCPPTTGSEINGAKAQLLNWVVAASLAAGKDFSPLLRDRWRFPLAPEVWQSLKTVDWKKPGLTADNVFDALPIDQLLPAVAMARPGFLTPERRKQNLLVGGTFEDGSGGTWTVGSFRGNAAAAAVEGGVAKEGQKAVVIRAPINDDARYLQKVAVKPNTRYLVSGWIKTKDVVVVEPTGRTGANLSIDAHTYEMSQSVVGTNDWRYASFLFDSGTRTEVLVCARIGFVYSTAKGEAWFDDLCLIPIGESPVRPTAPIPAATITTNKDWKGWSNDAPAPAIAPFDAAQAKQHQEAWAKHLGVPVEYTNSIGMKFRLIPPGEFTMGSTAAEIDSALNQGGLLQYIRDGIQSEAPQHKVILTQPIYLGMHEVTQGQYQTVTGRNPSHFANQGKGRDAVAGVDTKNHPVEMVSWPDAADFMASLGRREGRPPTSISYKLPTEAEWEFACRAGTTTKYWTGDNEDDLRTTAWYDKNSDQRTHAVGELKANPLGLFDIHGNVWEWVREAFERTHYEQFRDKPAIDPTFAPQANSECLIRGGNWLNTAPFGRSSGRLFLRVNPPYRLYHLGFRASLSVDAVKAALANPMQVEAPPVVNDAKEPLTLKGEHHGFTSVAFSSDSQRLATASIDQPVKVWDATNGQEIFTLKGGWCATFSPDGKRLASGGPDRMVRVFDTTSGQETFALQGHTNSVLSVAFSPDGTRLASASGDQTVKVWDVASGKESLTLKGHTGDVRSVAFSPDGKRLASGSRDQTLKLWDATSGQELLTLQGHAAEIRSVAFSPDGKWLASASHDQTVKLWDAASGQLSRTLEGHDSGVMSVTFSSDGARLVSASCDQSVKVWDSASGQVLLTLKGHNSQVVGVALSADGKRLASASYDRTVKVWAITPGTKPVVDATASGFVTRQIPAEEQTLIKEAISKSRPLTNGDFASGLEGWQIEGGANEFRTFAQGAETALTTAGINKDPITGRLYQCFKVPDDATELQFSIHGGADSQTTYVALWYSSMLQRRVSARNDNAPYRVSWNVMSLRGKVVMLEVVDNSTFSWGFIGAQGFALVRQKAAAAPANEQVVPADQEPLTLKGHSQAVTNVAISADGKRVASASRDQTVKIWDTSSGEAILSLKAASIGVALKPDGNWLATGAFDGTVNVADHFGIQEAITLKGHNNAISALAFNSDGKRLASASADGTLKVWDVAGGRETLTLKAHGQMIRSVAFTSDGKRILSSAYNDQAVKVWDAKSGQELLSLKAPVGGIHSAAMSPDGKRLVTAGLAGVVRVWDTTSGQEVLTLEGAPWCVAIDAEGKRLATVSHDNAVMLWDATSGQKLLTLKGHTHIIQSLAFSGDGKRLVSAGEDLTVKVWDLAPRSAADKKPSDPAAPNKKKTPTIPVLVDGQQLLTLKGHTAAVTSAAFSADGKRVVSASDDKTVKLWSTETGHETFSFKGHTAQVRCLAISPDGKRVASGGYDKLLRVWDSTSGRELVSMNATPNYLTSVAFSPDGKRLASAGILAVKVWDSTSGQEALSLKGHFTNVHCIAFSPDGKRLATGSGDMTVKLRDATTGQETLTLKGHIGDVTGVAFSPDSKWLASASHDQTVKVWDVATGKEKLTLIGHTTYVTGVAISPDGKRIASVSGDMTVRLWDSETGQETLTVKGHSHSVNSAGFRSDGKRLVTASGDGTVKLWDITNGPPTERPKDNPPRTNVVQVLNGWSRNAPAPAIAPFDAEQAQQFQAAWAKQLGVPVEYTNSIGMKFRLMPPGEFLMGSAPDEIDAAIKLVGNDKQRESWLRSEGPRHRVILTQPIYLSAHEVTQGEYEQVTGKRPSHFSASGAGQAAVAGIDTLRLPVDSVSWHDANEFCATLNQQEKLKLTGNGRGYRLPTEAEWEFACRAGTATSFWIGEKDQDLSQAGWFKTNTGNRTHPVGELKANPFGLYDMHGNVWEWVHDWRDPNYFEQFQELPALNPSGPSAEDDQRVLRGGSWAGVASFCRAAYRHSDVAPLRHRNCGFRAALSIAAVKSALVNAAPDATASVLSKDEHSLIFKGHSSDVVSVAFSPDGRQLSSVSAQGPLKVWDVTSGQEALTLYAGGYVLPNGLFSPDGQRLASASQQTVTVWDAMSGYDLLRFNGHSSVVSSLALSPDGNQIVTASYDQSVKVWDITTGQESLQLKGDTKGVLSVAFSPDGKRLASAGHQRTMKIWDAQSGRELHDLDAHRDAIYSVAFSSDGKRLASAGGDGRVKVWDAIAGDELLSLKGPRLNGRPAAVMGVTFSPDGQRLASASADKTIKVWDATTGQELHTLQGHTKEVRGVAFSPDGKWLASASSDQTIRLWEFVDRPRSPGDGSIVKANVVMKDADTDLKALEGTWQLSDLMADPPLPADREVMLKEHRWLIKGDVLTMFSGPRVEAYSLTLDPSQTPKAIDLTSFNENEADRTLMGIYSIDQDTLKICLSFGGDAQRPKEMQPAKDLGHIVHVLKRGNLPDDKGAARFDFHAWQQASKQLKKLKAKTTLNSAGASSNGFIELPWSATAGPLPNDAWTAISSITRFGIRTTSMTDAALRQLSEHRGLLYLGVIGSWSATSNGVAELKKCPNLQSVELVDIPNAPAALSSLSQLTDLQDLVLSRIPVSPELLTAISQFSKLESLYLAEPDLSDDDLVHITKLTNLKRLMLFKLKPPEAGKPKLTDKGLQALKSLKDLMYLDVRGHGISAEAVADFKGSLPNCQVLK